MGRWLGLTTGLLLAGWVAISGCSSGGGTGGGGGGARSVVGTWRFVAGRDLLTNETLTFADFAAGVPASCGIALTAINMTLGADGSFAFAFVVDDRTLAPNRGTYRVEGNRLIAAVTQTGATEVGCAQAEVSLIGAGGLNAELTWVDNDAFLLTDAREVNTFARGQVYPSAGDEEGRIISGRVTNALTGLGVGGVSVSAAGRTTTTSADGSYELTRLPRSGALSLTFTATGFSSRTVQLTDVTLTTVNVPLQPAGGTVGDVSQPPRPPDYDALGR